VVLNAFFVGVDEVDESEDVPAVGEAELAFALFEAGFGVGLVAAAIEDVGVESGFISGRLVDVAGDPIADFAVDDGIFDNAHEVLRMEAGGFEPEGVETLGEVGLIIGGEFTGAMEANLVDEAREVNPARHGFAGAPGIDDRAHGRDGCMGENGRKTECRGVAPGVAGRFGAFRAEEERSRIAQGMTWYFVNAGQQAGPISDIQLDEYILGGKIFPETLVWREGMDNWQPCREIKPALMLKAPPVRDAAPIVQSRGETTVDIVCAECGSLHPKDNAIRHGESWICGWCKPMHVQKLKEGVATAGSAKGMDYAGVGARALAKLLDGLIIVLPAVVLMVLVIVLATPLIGRNRGSSELGVLLMLGAIGVIGLAMVFFQIWCLPKYGATPGKRIMRLRVVTADGGSISWGRAIGRFFGEWVNGLIPFWIGYIIAAFDPERRTVHDHIAGTRVIKV
jgi:uncharacterized RDD family membrane protein YckC